MIGNDIVDIKQSRKESNWRRNGYLDKIFNNEEKFIIKNASNQEVMVWKLWSMKEAAYKIYNRQTGVRGFIPKQLRCELLLDDTDMVTCNGTVYYTKTTINPDYVYTVAVADKSMLANVNELHDAVIFKDNSGCPYIFDNKHLIPVSITHHGRFYKTISFKS